MSRAGETGGWPQRFSVSYINALKPRYRQYEKGERDTKGLRIIVYPSGVKSWRFVWARGRGVALGRYPQVSIAMARHEVSNVLQRIQEGADPKPLYLRPAEPRARRLRFSDYRDDYTKDFTALKRAEGFSAGSLDILKIVLNDLGGAYVDSFGYDDVIDYRTRLIEKGNAPVTVNRKIEALRPYWLWGRRHRTYRGARWPKLSPFVDPETGEKLQPLKKGNPRGEAVRWIPPEDETRIRAYSAEIGGHFEVAVAMALGAGMRPSELFRVRWEDVRENTIYVFKSKSATSRYARMDEPCRKLMTKWKRLHHNEPPDGNVLGVTTIKKPWLKMREVLGMPHTLHMCRHTYITRQRAAGVGWMTLGKLVGHSEQEMTDRYSFLDHELGLVDDRSISL